MKNTIWLCLLVVLCSRTDPSAAAEAPNIILILTDDHGWSQLSQPADPRVSDAVSRYLETPNMNRLAQSGMRFTSGYSPAPLCTPTRRSILCGSATARCGSEFKSDWVPADHMTIPQALKMANAEYRCAHFGKWGEQMISTPEECGYDSSDGMTGNNTGGMPRTLGIEGGHNDGPPHFIDNKDPKRTRSVTDRAIDFMQKQHESEHPFYVQVSYYAQHLSVVCTQEMLDKYEQKGEPDRGYTAAWAAMMDDLDEGVGRLLDTLNELGIDDNTYVFFTADNGGRGTVPGGDDSRLATNYPLTGAKHSLYEGGVRVPFFASGPGIEPGSVCHTPVVGYDLLPTFYDLAGGTNPKNKLTGDVDGISLRPLFNQPEMSLNRKDNAVYFHRPNKGFSSIRQGDDKLMVFWNRNGKITGRELYDLSSTPVEDGHNIAESNPQKADEMQKTLLTFLKSVDAEAPADFGAGRKNRNRSK
ncbi:sulfatase [Rubinisphaera margarita]|uniref:sulfatase n=1 Tax=Rubinisphaera margarita TaxID=2909586 RepID=UPI001EE97EA6|nr:sulfatase [Rubinisphaera margarita]MCG6157739.1 sulfatase [Rubinisphaera margarita]